MRAWWRRRNPPEVPPEEPRGVRILHGDGRVSECSVILDRIEDGLTWWMLVPPAGAQLDPLAGDAISVDALPGRTMVDVRPALKEAGPRRCR